MPQKIKIRSIIHTLDTNSQLNAFNLQLNTVNSQLSTQNSQFNVTNSLFNIQKLHLFKFYIFYSNYRNTYFCIKFFHLIFQKETKNSKKNHSLMQSIHNLIQLIHSLIKKSQFNTINLQFNIKKFIYLQSYSQCKTYISRILLTKFTIHRLNNL